MSSIPTKVKVGYLTYDIQLVQNLFNEDGQALYGEQSSFEQYIRLNITAAEDQIKAAFIHEILHAIIDQYYPMYLKHEERIVNSLTTGLTNLLNDNPDLMEYLCSN